VGRRLAARVVTGPLAFALGGLIELAAFVWATLRGRVARSRR
jgi:hypothetical protein